MTGERKPVGIATMLGQTCPKSATGARPAERIVGERNDSSVAAAAA
jgi:hypothetical protein